MGGRVDLAGAGPLDSHLGSNTEMLAVGSFRDSGFFFEGDRCSVFDWRYLKFFQQNQAAVEAPESAVLVRWETALKWEEAAKDRDGGKSGGDDN